MGFFDRFKKRDNNDIFSSDPITSSDNTLPQDISSQNDHLRTDNSMNQFKEMQYSEPPPQNYPPSTPFPGQQTYPQPTEPDHYQRDIELILAKLDAIKSEIDAMHQRIKRIEENSSQKSRTKYNW